MLKDEEDNREKVYQGGRWGLSQNGQRADA